MLDPKLRAAGFQEGLIAARDAIVCCTLNSVVGTRLSVRSSGTVEVAAEHHRSGPRELHEQHLMVRRMSGRRFDHHGSIAEHVVVGILDDGCLCWS